MRNNAVGLLATVSCCTIILVLQISPLQSADRVYRGEEEVIGRTVLDRKISLYKFGASEKPAILWVGGLHGDERLTVELLRDLINHLENAPGAIPTNLQIWIIPVLNVDGYVVASRHNANEVDLNRNFSTQNWQQRTFTNLTQYPNGGGQSPHSEPETKSLAEFITTHRNQLLTVVNVHCCGGVVMGSKQNRLTENLEKIFQQFSRFRTLNESWDQAAYPVTGSFSTWLWERHLIADVFLELDEADKMPFQSLNKAIFALLESVHAEVQQTR